MRGVERISIGDETPRALEKAVDRVGQTSRDLPVLAPLDSVPPTNPQERNRTATFTNRAPKLMKNQLSSPNRTRKTISLAERARLAASKLAYKKTRTVQTSTTRARW